MSMNNKTWEQAVEQLRNEPNNASLVYNAYYDDPLIDAAERYWNSEEWRQIVKYLPYNKGKALDVGAGRGIASYALTKEGFQVTALEPDTSGIVGSNAIKELSSNRNLSIEVVEEFSETLPFEDDQFDVVFARAVLHHTKNLDDACSEFIRVLKPNGVFIAVREHVISRIEDLPVFLDDHPLHNSYGGENAFVLEKYLSSIRGAGFEIDKVLAPFDSPINYHPFTTNSLKEELIERFSEKLFIPSRLIRRMVNYKYSWFFVKRVLNKIDKRPGRLYSFIATRP